MIRFWEHFIHPLLRALHPQHIVEIGSQAGGNTRNILLFCKDHGARATIIDPLPIGNHEEIRDLLKMHGQHKMALSLNALPGIADGDVYLIDGDHNWYTVFHEIDCIIQNALKHRADHLPVLLFHDIGWPYGKRDLYYDPSTLPPEGLLPYVKGGLHPGVNTPTEGQGFNAHLCNAIEENTQKNGVLTAIEDAAQKYAEHYDLYRIPGWHGLGLMAPKRGLPKAAQEVIASHFVLPSDLFAYAASLEQKRCEMLVEQHHWKHEVHAAERELRGVTRELNRHLSLLEKRKKELEQLQHFYAQLHSLKDALLTSKRWKIGNSAGNLAQGLRNHPKQLPQMFLQELTRGKYATAAQSTASFFLPSDIAEPEISPPATEATAPAPVIQRKPFDVAFIHALADSVDALFAEEERASHLLTICAAKQQATLLRTGTIKSYIQKLEAEQQRQHREFMKLASALQRILVSKRWKLGNAVGSAIDTLTRNEQLPPSHHILNLIERETNSAAVKRIRAREEEEENRRFIYRHYDNASLTYVHDRLSGKKPITIIIPVYNAPIQTERCIESVLKHTHTPYSLLLINDCSTDESVRPLLESYAHLPQIRIIHHEKNQGFVRTVNHGMCEAKGDVVLLNSDTEVTARWLQKLATAASSSPHIATVTPLSNAAGAFSVPKSGSVNDIPPHLGLDGMARLVENLSERIYPEAPTGNGFCIYIKREALDDVGAFDEETFGRGYGEENDFCMRALHKGWKHVIDDATFIYHERSASFGADKEALIRDNRAKLDARYPDYTARVKAFLEDPALMTIRERIHYGVLSDIKPKPRILYVLHQGGGGTPYTNMDLMQHLETSHQCFLLTSDGRTMVLWELLPHRSLEKRQSWQMDSLWQVDRFYNPEYAALYFSLLTGLNVGLIHIRHLLGHSFDLPAIANWLGLRIAMSFHDFYFVCPSTHLLDSKSHYCGGSCHAQSGQCKYPSSWLGDDAPHLSSFNSEWRTEVAKMFGHCDRFITTTQDARNVHLYAFGNSIPAEKFQVIEHGRDFPPADAVARCYKTPTPNKPIDILFPGQLGFNKGLELIRAMKALDKKGRLHFHFLGKGSEQLGDLGTVHGEYEREEFFDKVCAIQPSFIGILSIWPETYCHTLSESWACGVPVIASDIGAIAERVRNHGGGWLVDYIDPAKTYQQILDIAENLAEYERIAQSIKHIHLRTTQEMAADYLTLYAALEAA